MVKMRKSCHHCLVPGPTRLTRNTERCPKQTTASKRDRIIGNWLGYEYCDYVFLTVYRSWKHKFLWLCMKIARNQSVVHMHGMRNSTRNQTQLHSERKEKRAALGGIRAHDTLLSRRPLYQLVCTTM